MEKVLVMFQDIIHYALQPCNLKSQITMRN